MYIKLVDRAFFPLRHYMFLSQHRGERNVIIVVSLSRGCICASETIVFENICGRERKSDNNTVLVSKFSFDAASMGSYFMDVPLLSYDDNAGLGRKKIKN